jgi:hypothetical protein
MMATWVPESKKTNLVGWAKWLILKQNFWLPDLDWKQGPAE